MSLETMLNKARRVMEALAKTGHRVDHIDAADLRVLANIGEDLENKVPLAERGLRDLDRLIKKIAGQSTDINGARQEVLHMMAQEKMVTSRADQALLSRKLGELKDETLEPVRMANRAERAQNLGPLGNEIRALSEQGHHGLANALTKHEDLIGTLREQARTGKLDDYFGAHTHTNSEHGLREAYKDYAAAYREAHPNAPQGTERDAFFKLVGGGNAPEASQNRATLGRIIDSSDNGRPAPVETAVRREPELVEAQPRRAEETPPHQPEARPNTPHVVTPESTEAMRRNLTSAVDHLVFAVNASQRTLADSAQSAARTAASIMPKKGVPSQPMMGAMQEAPQDIKKAEVISHAMDHIRELAASPEYRNLPTHAKAGDLSPPDTIKALRDGVFQVAPSDLSRLNDRVARGRINSPALRNTLLATGALTVAAGGTLIASSMSDPFDDALGSLATIEYQAKRNFISFDGDLKKGWVDDVLATNPNDPVARALQGNFAKLNRDQENVSAGQATAERAKYTSDSRNAPAVDLSTYGLGMTPTPAIPSAASASTPSDYTLTVNGQTVGDNIRSAYQSGVIKKFEANQIALSWQDTTHMPVSTDKEFSPDNKATPVELQAFREETKRILENGTVGRSPEATKQAMDMIFKPQ